MHDGATVVLARDVLGGVDGDHTVLSQDGRLINTRSNQLSVRNRREHQGRVKRSSQLWQIVGVYRLTTHMQMGRFVHQLAALLITLH